MTKFRPVASPGLAESVGATGAGRHAGRGRSGSRSENEKFAWAAGAPPQRLGDACGEECGGSGRPFASVVGRALKVVEQGSDRSRRPLSAAWVDPDDIIEAAPIWTGMADMPEVPKRVFLLHLQPAYNGVLSM